MLEDRLPAGLTGRARFVLDGLNGRETRTVAYHMPALPRGSYNAGPLRVRLTDPFGLIDTTRSFTARSRFVITPIVDRLPDLHLPNSWDLGENAGSHSIGSRGADDASTREWRHGDDLRKIHWRSTARTGAIMVRHEERPWQGHATLVLDLRAHAHNASPHAASIGDDRDDRSIEWAISAVASIGSQLFLTGRAVLGRVDDASVHALAEAHPRGSATPAFAMLLDVDSWYNAGAGDQAAGASPAPGTIWTAESRRVAETLRAAGWCVVPARAGDSIPSVWTRLLRQRAASPGSSARLAAPRLTTLQ